MSKNIQKKKVIIIGAGLSGLTAANQLLKAQPNTQVVVLEALDRVGGRTHSVDVNGFIFDQGAEFIGQSQQHVIKLAQESKNELIQQFHDGKKIIEMQKQYFTYTSNIPNNLSYYGLIQLQVLIWKINRMSSKVTSLNPKDCQLGYEWDAKSVQTWIDQNIKNQRIKVMIEIACRSIFGAEPSEISFLFFLWYTNQNKDFENLINVQNGLQQMKTKLGTQHFSKYLSEQVKSRGGQVYLNIHINSIQQSQQRCFIEDKSGIKYQCDYAILALSPWQANKITYTPKLSMDRKMLCGRNFMGSYIKVILLYRRAYWKEKGFSGQILTDCSDSPLMTAFDDTKVNEKGQIQPALIVFLGGYMYRYWKNQQNFEHLLVHKIADILKEPEMKEPIKVFWKAWEDEPTIGGGPTGIFAPGVLSQIEDLRRPQGRIHWAGTQMATVSIGYMDGAIQSGKRVSEQLIRRINGKQAEQKQQKKQQKGFWYTKYLRGLSKYFQWY